MGGGGRGGLYGKNYCQQTSCLFLDQLFQLVSTNFKDLISTRHNPVFKHSTLDRQNIHIILTKTLLQKKRKMYLLSSCTQTSEPYPHSLLSPLHRGQIWFVWGLLLRPKPLNQHLVLLTLPQSRMEAPFVLHIWLTAFQPGIEKKRSSKLFIQNRINLNENLLNFFER